MFEGDDVLALKFADVVLVDDRRAGSDDSPLNGHGEVEGMIKSIDTEQTPVKETQVMHGVGECRGLLV